MKHSHITKIMSCVLAVIMLMGTFATIVSAAEDESEEVVTTSNETATTESVTLSDSNPYFTDEELAQMVRAYEYPYEDYIAKYGSEAKGADEITVNAVDYDAESTTAEVSVTEIEGEQALYSPIEGNITYKVNIKNAGLYTIKLRYYQTSEEEDSDAISVIERGLMIDGDYPFSEVRYLYFPRLWEYELDEDGNFTKDKNGNDFRPIRVQSLQWFEYYVRDWVGYSSEPFEFYLSEGEHEITFIGSREAVYYGSFTLKAIDDTPTYEEFIKQCKEDGVEEITDVDDIIIQAEKPTTTSNSQIFPTVERTSCLNYPQDSAKLLYNCLTATALNQFVTYKVTVPKSGLYQISTRFRQNGLIGMFCSRKVMVNGELQFQEAAECRFVYSPQWQSQVLTDGENEFLFYLEEGENELTFETVLGDFADYCYEVRNIADELTEVYYKIVKIAGRQPDSYRDYGFSRVIPEVIDTMAIASKRLYEIADIFIEMTGEASEPTAMLETYAWLYNEMAQDEYKIASNFVTYKKYVVGLYDWILTCMSQKVLIDEICIQSVGAEVPQAKATFFQQAWFECKAFVASFFMDYTSIGFAEDETASDTEEKSVKIWSVGSSASSREAGLILRMYTDKYFTAQTGIKVNIEVISAGLTEAILAGIGPDISFMDPATATSMGLRGGVEDLSGMSGLAELAEEFGEAEMDAVSLEDAVYGIPVTISYKAVFYRADILDQLGLEVPNTWDELKEMLPLLQNQNMEIGVDHLTDLYITLVQNGNGVEGIYAEDGMRVGLDSKEALTTFESWCDFYSKYNTQVESTDSYALATTRMRLGEVPILVGDIVNAYNTLMGFTEIRGLWAIAPILGTEREDGTIDRTNIVTVTSCMVIPKGCSDIESAWEYVKWYTGYEGQTVLTKENIALGGGTTTKYAVANQKVFLEEPWTSKELAVVEETLNDLVGIPSYPGYYLVNNYVNFAFMEVYSSGADAGVSLLDRITPMNIELSRKREEYGLDYYIIDYTGDYSEDNIVRQSK